jgi:serine/threonine-protein kinase
MQSDVPTLVEPASSGSEPPVDLGGGLEFPSAGVAFGERYERGPELGKGGMGQVLSCRDLALGRRIAMKIMLGGDAALDDAQRRQRFTREVLVQGQLEHPAIVPVYDLGIDPDGRPYFTMKRVRGVTLKSILAKLAAGDPSTARRYSRRRLLAAFASVCLAIDFAHRRGVLHRDLKPENIMLGDYGEVYVLDWGVARIEADGVLADARDPAQPDIATRPTIVAGAARDTQVGTMLGTLGYMPGEQLRGEWSRVGPTADVFALGAILFELLTVQPLIPRGDAYTMVTNTNDGVEARPSVRAPELELEPELDEICVRATATNPEDRYASAGELQQALERFLDGERNSQLRRDLAAAHIDAARRQLAAASSDLEARRVALGEVGRALALDPDNPHVLELLESLLAAPTQALPEEVERAVEAEEAAMRKRDAPVAALAYLSFVLYLPLLVWMGIRNVGAIVLFYALMLGSVGLCGWIHRRPSERKVLWLVVLANAGYAALAPLFGSLFLSAAVVAVHTTCFALHFERRNRWAAMATGLLAIAVPLALELTGVLPSSLRFTDGMIGIAPTMVEFRPLPTLVFLTVLNLMNVVNGTIATGRMKDTLLEVQERLHLQSWHLRQLVGHRR